MPPAIPARNAISAGSLEHKMGIQLRQRHRGDESGRTGWLLGEVNKGMACMFTMMNAARLGIGMHGLGHRKSPARTL